MTWRNRIVGSGEEKPSDLVANPRNWRVHPMKQGAALEEVLDRVGWVAQVLVNRRTGVVVDGHLRVALAVRRDEASIPVVYVDLDESEEALILATLDPLGAMALTDAELLRALAAEVVEEGALADMVADVLGDPVEAMSFDERMQEWGGMPSFEQGDQTAWRSIRVNFAGPEQLAAFAKLIGQPVSETTRSVWYPAAEIAHYADKRFRAAG